MSAWQRWQASDFMKYWEGMPPPCLVCAELGKNLPCGPSPSPSMVSAGISGLDMQLAFLQATSRVHQAPAAILAVNRANAANPKPRPRMLSPSHPFEMSHEVTSKSMPRTHNAMCTYNHFFR